MEDDLQPNELAIGVTCMYSKQREIIDKMVSEAVWLENREEAAACCEFGSTARARAKEGELIRILFTVRITLALKPGSGESHRINAAMSRASGPPLSIAGAHEWDGRNADPLPAVRKRVCEMAAQQRPRCLTFEPFW